MTSEETVSELFPDVPHKARPLGPHIVVQLKSPKTKTKGGIILATESQEIEKETVVIGRIVAMGALAFKDRKAMTVWPEHDPERADEGAFPITVGQFVRVPRYGGDRWRVVHGDKEGLFALLKDLDILSAIDASDIDEFKPFY